MQMYFHQWHLDRFHYSLLVGNHNTCIVDLPTRKRGVMRCTSGIVRTFGWPCVSTSLGLGMQCGNWCWGWKWVTEHSSIHSFICNCCVFQPICCMSQQVRRESVGHFRRGRRCLSVGRRYAAWKSIWEACSTGDGWILVLTNVTKGGETKSLINRTYDSRRDQLHGHQGRKWSHCNLLRHHTYDLPHTYLQSHTCFVHIRPIDGQRLQEVKVHHIPNKVNWREETAR